MRCVLSSGAWWITRILDGVRCSSLVVDIGEEWWLVQLLEFGERSNRWWNGSIQLIEVQGSVVLSISTSVRVVSGVNMRLKVHNPLLAIVQFRESSERSDCWWNSSRELIREQVANIEQSSHTLSLVDASLSQERNSRWASYRSIRLVSNPISDGMVPESWFADKSLSSGHVERECVCVCSRQYIVHRRSVIGKWDYATVGCHLCRMMGLVQELKIRERTNGCWNGSHEKVTVQVAVAAERCN